MPRVVVGGVCVLLGGGGKELTSWATGLVKEPRVKTAAGLRGLPHGPRSVGRGGECGGWEGGSGPHLPDNLPLLNLKDGTAAASGLPVVARLRGELCLLSSTWVKLFPFFFFQRCSRQG